MKMMRGFTLIELLVVISIIAILASIILTSLETSQQKGRDARRVSDIKQIQLALSLYYNDNDCYPPDIYSSAACGSATSGLSPNYISVIPTDPSYSVSALTCATASPNTPGCYNYAPLTSTTGGTSCTSYHLGATLELQTDVPNDSVGLNAANVNTADTRGLYLCGSGVADFDGTVAKKYDVTP